MALQRRLGCGRADLTIDRPFTVPYGPEGRRHCCAAREALASRVALIDELKDQSRRFLSEFVKAIKSGQVEDITGPAWSAVRDLLGGISRSRALQGFTPTETATFVFSL